MPQGSRHPWPLHSPTETQMCWFKSLPSHRCGPSHTSRSGESRSGCPTGTQMSWLEPLTTRRNPDVLTWSPHTPGRCPSLALPPAHRNARSPGMASAIPQRDTDPLVRSPQGSAILQGDPNVLVRSPQCPRGTRVSQYRPTPIPQWPGGSQLGPPNTPRSRRLGPTPPQSPTESLRFPPGSKSRIPLGP